MKIRVFLIVLMLLTTLLCSCSEETNKLTENKEHQENDTNANKEDLDLEFDYNNQHFKIISFLDDYTEFIRKAKEQPEDVGKLYNQMISEKFTRETGIVVGLSILAIPQHIDLLERNVNSLIDKTDLINHSIEESLMDSANYLKGEDISIYIFPALPEGREFLRSMNYVAGFTYSKNTILFLVDPSFLVKNLKSMIAHEYHHAIYLGTPEVSRNTLLDTSIVEGKADKFSEIVYPDADIPWADPIPNLENQEVWKLFNKNIHMTDSVTKDMFLNGNPNKGIPSWSNYKIGYQIVDSYLEKNPQVSIEEWTALPAQEMYEKSGMKK